MNQRSWSLLVLLGSAVVLLLYLGWRLPQVQWDTNITAALPHAAEPWQQAILQSNQSKQQLAVLLRGYDDSTLQQITAQLVEQPIAGLIWQQPAELMREYRATVQPYQGLLVSAQQLTYLRQHQYESLIQAAWHRLLSPMPVPQQALERDPLLLTTQFLEQAPLHHAWQPGEHGLIRRQPQNPAILMTASLTIDPFERARASALLQQLETQLRQVQHDWPAVQLDTSGVIFHAVKIADRARFEMQWFATLSLVGILLLLWLTFASFRPLLLALSILSLATIAGLSTLLLLFPRPHLLALVFATTLIGIAIDYSFHSLLAIQRGVAAFKAMLPTLTLSVFTTLIGYLALLLLPFELLLQVAVFVCTGLLAAYGSVRLLTPLWAPAGSVQYRPILGDYSQRISQWYLQQKPKAVAAWLLALAFFGLVGGFALLDFQDDVRLMSQSPASLLLSEQRLRAETGINWDRQIVVTLASDPESLLQQEQQLLHNLQLWSDQGMLQHWQALSDRLPSIRQQQETQLLLQQAYQQPEVQAYLQQLQLTVPAVTTDFLTLDQLPAVLQQNYIQLDDKVAGITLLQQAQLSEEALAHLVAMPNVHWFDPLENINTSLEFIRAQLMSWLSLALLLAVCLLCLRLGVATGLWSGLLLLVVLLGSLLIGFSVHKTLTVFHLVGALLVLALSLDYTIFFASRLPHADIALAVFLSAMTSSLAFGMLSFSQTPAIAGFGLTVSAGILLAAVLSPLVRLSCKQETTA